MANPMKSVKEKIVLRSWVASIACGTLVGAGCATAGEETGLQPTLKKVVAKCPASYPEKVTATPDREALQAQSKTELLDLLASWNPVVRKAAAGEIGRRGDALLPRLKEVATADKWQLREGALTALINIVREEMRNWKTLYPELKNFKQARAKIRAKYADLAPIFIEATKDPHRSVRHRALGGIQRLAPHSKEAVEAVLALCGDEDVYIAQGAMATLAKTLDISQVDKETLIPAFKAAMRTPLPRGKAFIVRLIEKMDAENQRVFVPELLYHLDWQPARDTMFGAGGQAEAVRILTKLEVKELVPRIPALMTKTMRGPGLFEPCIKSMLAFGKDAKPILPELREYLSELEQNLTTAHPRRKKGIEQKITKLKDAITHVEEL